jgi:hypothetical protein
MANTKVNRSDHGTWSNTYLHINLFIWYHLQLNITEPYAFLLSTEFCVFSTPTIQRKVAPRIASSLAKPNTPLCTEMILLVEIQI